MASPKTATAPVGLPRRLAAMTYDGLLLLAMIMAVEFFIVAAFGITDEHPLFLPLRLYIPLVAFGFLGWCWTRQRGQTLGMQAWKIRLVDMAGKQVTWRQAGIRFGVALGQWCLVVAAAALYIRGWWIAALPFVALVAAGLARAQRDPERLMLHDRLSGTKLERV
ncbi:hypothetical protein B1C78_09910 [Thioalkalivibrio denitrificans]|uniref:RDD domain-containing protein n=1 Tax=Thioalkalivibrio denitrificans TaxID=108003 RepID=A0A1V3NG38_9GAMM|nr:RDD family protein [Thioalkalivibrio denitrificans]OOG23838.1 hypothetical protein B1C78_09910 [Thioalkalivibrio denitrificans]